MTTHPPEMPEFIWVSPFSTESQHAHDKSKLVRFMGHNQNVSPSQNVRYRLAQTPTATDSEAQKALDELEILEKNYDYPELGKYRVSDASFKTIRAALSRMAPVPDGWKLVPIEPDFTMYNAGQQANVGPVSTRPKYIYKAMIAAAPPADREG